MNIFCLGSPWWSGDPTSTCFVRSCGIELWAISMAALLSQWRSIGFLDLKPNPFNTFLTYNNSYTPCAIPLYYASALDLGTTFCFLLRQVTKLPPTNVKILGVNRLFLSSSFFFLEKEDHLSKLAPTNVKYPPNLHLCIPQHWEYHSWQTTILYLEHSSDTFKFYGLHSYVLHLKHA